MKNPLFLLSLLFVFIASPLQAATDEEMADTAAGIAYDSRDLKDQIDDLRTSTNSRGAIRQLRTINLLALDLVDLLDSGDYNDYQEIVDAGAEIEEEFLILSRYFRGLSRSISVRYDRDMQSRFRLLRAKVYFLQAQISGDE